MRLGVCNGPTPADALRGLFLTLLVLAPIFLTLPLAGQPAFEAGAQQRGSSSNATCFHLGSALAVHCLEPMSLHAVTPPAGLQFSDHAPVVQALRTERERLWKELQAERAANALLAAELQDATAAKRRLGEALIVAGGTLVNAGGELISSPSAAV